MKITVVMGFFLPMPPALGGATEKTWHRLAAEFAAAGHEVTLISRQWPGWPDRESAAGVAHVRLPGYDHRRRLWQNLWLDLRWSARVQRHLPPADIAVVHAVALPVWLGRRRPAAGRVVVMPGRMPKGQYRLYSHLARVLATSTPVRERVLAENPALAPLTRIVGYPIDHARLAQPRPAATHAELAIGYVGRLHPEKGLDLLLAAATLLARDTTLPRWRLALRGPHRVAAGGGGEEYRAALEARLRQSLPPERWTLEGPLVDEGALAAHYRSLDLFCYPSLAVAGETFGVAVAEAMAAGAVPVVSDLACFRDLVQPGENGAIFDHAAADAPARLAESLAALLRSPEARCRLAAAAQRSVARLDAPRYARDLLDDFSALAANFAPAKGL